MGLHVKEPVLFFHMAAPARQNEKMPMSHLSPVNPGHWSMAHISDASPQQTSHRWRGKKPNELESTTGKKQLSCVKLDQELNI